MEDTEAAHNADLKVVAIFAVAFASLLGAVPPILQVPTGGGLCRIFIA